MVVLTLFFTMWALCFNYSTAFVTHDQRHVQPPLGVAEVRVEHDDGNSKGVFMLALAIASALIGGLLLFLCCLWLFKLQRLKNSTRNGAHHLDDGAKERPLVPIFGKINSLRMGGKKGNVSFIEYHVLEQATGNFEESNKIGEGKQGVVYRACLGESFAAVKKFNNDRTHQKFQNEVVWLSKLHHQNIITLLGYSIREESRLLVYEMMQNGSLENQLHGPSSGSGLTWSLRMKIALDVARGLEYLHERCEPAVLHGDLKSSNILLDSKFNAKISGFSHAISVGKSNNDFKVSETSGYSAPEYLLDGKPTDKVDVYAFGVVLLELLTGRKPVEKMSRERHRSIVTWAMPQLTDRSKLPHIVHPVIRDKMDHKHLYQVAAVAVLCVQPEPSYRPLITDVLHSLIPLVPVHLGGSLRAAETSSTNS